MSLKSFVEAGRRLLLASSATLAVATGIGVQAEAAPVLTGALKEQVEFLCMRREFTRSEIKALQKSAEFPQILAYTLEVCPNVAAVLTDGATASTSSPSSQSGDDKDRTPDTQREPEEKSKGI